MNNIFYIQYVSTFEFVKLLVIENNNLPCKKPYKPTETVQKSSTLGPLTKSNLGSSLEVRIHIKCTQFSKVQK